MPDLNMHDLYQELKSTQSTSEKYAPFLEAMETLDAEMNSLMEPDENGWKLLTPERFQSFSDKYHDASIKLEQYLAQTYETKDPLEKITREKAQKLAELMAKDTAVFRKYNPNIPARQRSLPSLLEESRIPTVDISSTDLESIGGAQSSRIPMTIYDNNGQPMSGVFTKASYFDPSGKLNRAIERASKADGISVQGQNLLKNFIMTYQTYYQAHPDEKHPVSPAPEMIDRLLRSCLKNSRKGGGWRMSVDKIAEEIAKVNNMSDVEVHQALGKKALKKLADGMEDMGFETYINNAEIKMTDKARIDSKNAGMSIVADLMGVSHVVCHAETMKIKDANGNIVDGTFMAMAKGVDPNNPTKDGSKVNADSLKNTDGRGLAAIADLQVLDYICGNVDRHGGNMFYQFDENGKLIGVQGIDNDSAFGLFTPQLQKDTVRRMPVAPTMGVIHKETAEKILNMKPEELSFALRGTIDEPSIKAYCFRLYILQHVIKLSREKLNQNTKDIQYPYLRELTTKEFAHADLKKLTDPKMNNHFREANSRIAYIGASARISNEPLSAKAVGSSNRATQAGIIGQAEKANQMKAKLKARTSFFRGSSSQNYLDIEKAVEEYGQLQQKIQQRMTDSRKKLADGDISPDTAFGQYVTGFDLDKMREGLKKIQAAADKYVAGKLAELASKGKKPEDDNYIKNRIDLAREISQYAKDHLELSAEEKQTLAHNDRRSMEDYVRGQTKETEQNVAEPTVVKESQL